MIPGKVRAGVLSAVHKAVADRLFAAFMLWLISRKPAHGYGIIRILRKEHQFAHIGPAMVYPMLARLSTRGLIRAKKEANGKRVRKLYSITPAGRKSLQEVKRMFSRDSLRTRFMREMLS